MRNESNTDKQRETYQSVSNTSHYITQFLLILSAFLLGLLIQNYLIHNNFCVQLG